MLDNEKIRTRRLEIFISNGAIDIVAAESWEAGAKWANSQNAKEFGELSNLANAAVNTAEMWKTDSEAKAAEIARLEVEKSILLEALETALAHGIHTREGRDMVRAIADKYKQA